jgi:hypothetical protein
MANFHYEATVLSADCAWSRLPPALRSRSAWTLWAITWLGLVAGCADARYWRWVVWLSIAHALFMLLMVKVRPLVFPAQLRLAYAAWVAVGTFVPHMRWMLYVTLVGLAANLTFNWCPLSRMLYLLPWNRREPWDAGLPFRAFFSKPVPGRFQAPPPKRVAAGPHPR